MFKAFYFYWTKEGTESIVINTLEMLSLPGHLHTSGPGRERSLPHTVRVSDAGPRTRGRRGPAFLHSRALVTFTAPSHDPVPREPLSGGPVHRQALFPLAVASTGLVPEKTWTETFEKGVSVPKGCQ